MPKLQEQMKNLFACLLIVFGATLNQSFASTTVEDANHGVEISHEAFNILLKKYVDKDGKVDYDGFKKSEEALNDYLKHLGSYRVNDKWSKNAQMVYWINAYNAGTIALVLKHYPLKSIKQIHEGKPWDFKFLRMGKQTYSLNQIEHQILRKQFKDARIHFVLNCAARGCPPLHNRAFTVSNLDLLLEGRTREFIRGQNKIEPGFTKLSKIFEWYAEDFGDLKEFINKYSLKKINRNTVIDYKPYNWGLNKK